MLTGKYLMVVTKMRNDLDYMMKVLMAGRDMRKEPPTAEEVALSAASDWLGNALEPLTPEERIQWDNVKVEVCDELSTDPIEQFENYLTDVDRRNFIKVHSIPDMGGIKL